MLDTNILLNFLISMAIGGLLGVERERDQKGKSFAGIRTFVLTTFTGSFTAFLYNEFQLSFIIPLVFLSIMTLVSISYYVSAIHGHIGITSELSIILAFLLGFVLMFDPFRSYAVIIAIFITTLLTLKNFLHNIIAHTKDIEWYDTLKFAVITFVIFPLLPEKLDLHIFSSGQFEDLNYIYPREIWLLIIFVSGISFLGYFLVKAVGKSKGILLTGAFGGLVSSTAVNASMAHFSKQESDRNRGIFIAATTIADASSIVKIIIITLVINPSLIVLIIPLGMIFLLKMIKLATMIHWKYRSNKQLDLGTPFAFKPAVILGCIFLLTTVIYKFSVAMDVGALGVMITSFVGGLVDVDPVILSVSSLSLKGFITSSVTVNSIVIAYLANLVVKSSIAYLSGSHRYSSYLIKWNAACIIAGLAWIIATSL